MYKLRFALIPACISFGPLFMTNVGGLLGEKFSPAVTLLGAALLATGLHLMFALVMEQCKSRSAS